MKRTVFVSFLVLVILFSSLHLAFGIDLSVIYAQDDPAWGEKLLDSTNLPIKDWGCLLTSTAMLLNYYGYPVDPLTLNDWMIENGGFFNGGNMDVAIVSKYTQGAIYKVSADLNFAQMDEGLANGRPTILKVHTNKIGMHFVVVVGKNGDTYDIIDPLGGKKTTLKNEGYIVDNIDHFMGLVPDSFKPSPTPSPTPQPVPQPTPPQKSQVNRAALFLIDNFYWYGEHNIKATGSVIDLWVDLLEPGTKVWVASFTTKVTPLIEGLKIETDADKTHLKKVIKTLLPNPESSFFLCSTLNDLSEALGYGFRKLNPQNAKEKIVYILTDGRNDPGMISLRIDEDILTGYGERNIKIYPIPVPPENWEVLQEMTEKTGGKLSKEIYESDPQNSQINTLLYLSDQLTPSQESDFEKTYEFKKSGEEFEELLDIAPGTLKEIIGEFWDGSKFKIELTDPYGKKINPEKSSDIYYSSGDSHEFLILNYPTPGKWKVKIKGIEVPLEGERVKLISKSQVDILGPKIKFNLPLYHKRPLNLTANITDELSGVSYVGFYFGTKKSYWKPISINKKPKTNINVKWKPEKDGEYLLGVDASDGVGNSSFVVKKIIVDSTKPQIKDIQIKLPGLFDDKIKVNFKGTDKHLKENKIILTDGLEKIVYQTKESLTKKTFRTKELSKKPLKLILISKDRAGNITRKEYEIKITFWTRFWQITKDISESTVNLATTNPLLRFFMI